MSISLKQGQIFLRQQKRNLYIKSQITPNTNALIFKIDLPPLSGEINNEKKNERIELLSRKDIISKLKPNSPLALMSQDLFEIGGIDGLLIDYSSTLTINKNNIHNWDYLKPLIYSSITNRLSQYTEEKWNNDISLKNENILRNENISLTAADNEIILMIKEILESKIRPSVQADGGDVSFVSWNPQNGSCTLMLQGACRSCAMSSQTLKNGIERMLMHYIPEILLVEQEI